VNFDQRLEQEIPEVEIDAEEEDQEIEIAESIVIAMTLVQMRLNHRSRSFHDQSPMKAGPLLD